MRASGEPAKQEEISLEIKLQECLVHLGILYLIPEWVVDGELKLSYVSLTVKDEWK